MKIFGKGFNFGQDGPGNRLVYHLSGCNMKCIWCSNPEGMDVSVGKETTPQEIIKECIEKHLIYEEKHYHNAVFLGYDDFGNIKYAGCRSTNETIFKQDATGSDKMYSFRLESEEKTNERNYKL